MSLRARSLPALLALLTLLALPASAQNRSASPAAVRAALDHVRGQVSAASARAAAGGDLAVTDAYADAATGLTYVYLRQQIDGVDVPEASVTVTVGRDGRVAHAAGELAADLAAAVGRQPALTAAAAAARVAGLVGLGSSAFGVAEQSAGAARETVLTKGGVALEPVTARLVYRRDGRDGGPLRLAWEVSLYQADGQHWWVVAVDAATGAELHRYDRVVSDTWGPAAPPQPVQPTAGAGPLRTRGTDDVGPLALVGVLTNAYRAYALPTESPGHAGSTSADLRTTVANPADALASPFGWHDTDGAAGAEFTITRGNNVWAATDVDGTNGPDPTGAPDGGAGLDFTPPLDLALAPSGYRPAAVVNLFYWNNVMHDVFYRYGFTEAAGNFQTNTYGRGGAGGDAVLAEAQDSGGTNNANFATPLDGQPGRMQMYVWTAPTPDRDGDLDNGIVAHEYGHGISHRLVGGPSTECFFNAERADEGLSDWYGLMLTMRAGDTRAQPRGVGTYALNQPTTGGGIRSAPYQPAPGAAYSTSFAVNSATYGATTTAGQPGRLSVPHGVGFVWGTILWEVTWDMIDAHGFSPNIYDASGTAGNQILLRLMVQALKMAPCDPGFVDLRNALLAADAALYPDPATPGRGLHYGTLWGAFARRGLGFSAVQGSSTLNSDNVEAFDLPLPPAAASVTPASFAVTVAQGSTTSAPLTIGNTAAAGSQNLNWTTGIVFQPALGARPPDAAARSDVPVPSGEIVVTGRAAKGGPDDTAGTGTAGTGTAASLTGGPDGFGYVFADSDEPGGPAVAFQDIAATGTPVTWTNTDDGYADVALPFGFPFYGTTRTTARVYTNGFLTFSAFNSAGFTNAAIPSSGVPNALVAALWDDLDFTGAGAAYTGTLPDGRFVVQYTNAKIFGAAGTSLTFEVILSADGTIEYQYGTLTGTLTSASVGIEDDAGAVGSQVVFNAAYLASNKAVRFTSPTIWASVAPPSGSVAPGATQTPVVTFTAGDLALGVYTATLTVRTNDPARPAVAVPLQLTVGVPNTPPVANAGPDQTVIAGQTVTLSGAASSDPDGNALTYAWTLAPAVPLSSATSVGPTFCAATAGVTTATLVVRDGTADSAPDTATVTALSATAALDRLAADVAALRAAGVLTGGQANALTQKVDQARREVARRRPAQAAVHLAALAAQVASFQADGVLTAAQAAALTGAASALRAALVTPCTAAPALAAKAAAEGLGAAYPNPARAGVTVPFAVAEASPVRLVVYDALGREVAVLVDAVVEAGPHEAALSAAGLPAGVYLVRFTTGGGVSQTQRLTLVR